MGKFEDIKKQFFPDIRFSFHLVMSLAVFILILVLFASLLQASSKLDYRNTHFLIEEGENISKISHVTVRWDFTKNRWYTVAPFVDLSETTLYLRLNDVYLEENQGEFKFNIEQFVDGDRKNDLVGEDRIEYRDGCKITSEGTEIRFSVVNKSEKCAVRIEYNIKEGFEPNGDFALYDYAKKAVYDRLSVRIDPLYYSCGFGCAERELPTEGKAETDLSQGFVSFNALADNYEDENNVWLTVASVPGDARSTKIQIYAILFSILLGLWIPGVINDLKSMKQHN